MCLGCVSRLVGAGVSGRQAAVDPPDGARREEGLPRGGAGPIRARGPLVPAGPGGPPGGPAGWQPGGGQGPGGPGRRGGHPGSQGLPQGPPHQQERPGEARRSQPLPSFFLLMFFK
eukprot:scaffold213416_cov24-Prasinocladus_malaysianus.AAC.1